MARRITVIGTGGTIAMSAAAGGLMPARAAGDLLRDVSASIPGVDVHAVDAFNKASANIGFGDLDVIAGIITHEVQAGCEGIVLVQGTDTIEETAFALELLTTQAPPLVVTGAMRGASSLGADGPANLAGAIIAARDGAPEAGVMVVLNDEAHAARWVRKAHTTALDAFDSGEEGCIGRIHEGRLALSRTPPARLRLPPATAGRSRPRIAHLTITMADDGALLNAVPDLGFEGCVIEAMGAGHAPEALAPIIGALAARMPVALASRTGDGRVCTQTYGYPGSETDLIRRGVIPAGRLSGLKARVLLTLCVARYGRAAPEIFASVAASV